jgi:antitoxin CptB
MRDMSAPDLDTRRKRLRYRSWHRGCKETDLIFGPFADAHVAGLSEAEISSFEALLDEADNDLFEWLTGRVRPPERVLTELWRRLESFNRAKFAP